MRKRQPNVNDIDSIEFTLFNKRGESIIKWRHNPKNLKSAVDFLRIKGVKL